MHCIMGRRLAIVAFLGFLGACVNGERKENPKLLVGTAVRTFKDRKNSAEVSTRVEVPPSKPKNLQTWRRVQGVGSDITALGAQLKEPRRTGTEVFVFKKPEFDTYFYYNKKGEVTGTALTIAVLAENGRIVTAAFTSLGDPDKKAVNSRTGLPTSGFMIPNGTYSVDAIFLKRNSRSYTYYNKAAKKHLPAPMNYAIFIYNGVAMHQTSRSNYGNLGNEASMGCLRLNEAAAMAVFETVQAKEVKSAKAGAERFPDVTYHVMDNGVREYFNEDDVLRALRENVSAEAALRKNRQ